MFHDILVLVQRMEKVTESNRKYQQVIVKTEKAEYGHVLTHALSQWMGEIHNTHFSAADDHYWTLLCLAFSVGLSLSSCGISTLRIQIDM